MSLKIKTECLLIFLFFFIHGFRVESAQPTDFEYKSEIKSQTVSGKFVRIHISSDIISKTKPDFRDLRVFDETGMEIPIVIHQEKEAKKKYYQFHWKIIDYEYNAASQIIILEKPDDINSYYNFLLSIPRKNFQKQIIVLLSNDRKNWKKLTEGTIYDFSAEINLRNTKVQTNEVSKRFVKLVIVNKVNEKKIDKISLNYKNLQFSINNHAVSNKLKIMNLTSYKGPKQNTKVHFDNVSLVPINTSSDEKGNTILDFGYLNLPVEQINISTERPYFYRNIQLLTATDKTPEIYNFYSSDTVFRFPGKQAYKTLLKIQNHRVIYARLRIINNDNPPLFIKECSFEWKRFQLLFFPETNHHYTMFFGSNVAKKPSYEIGQLLPKDESKLMKLKEWKISEVADNILYRPKPNKSDAEFLERIILIFIIIFIAVIMFFWVVKLLKTKLNTSNNNI